LILAPVWLGAIARAGTFSVGFVSWDVNFPANAGQFDIVNETGVNSEPSPGTDFPISTAVNLAGLGLTVSFADGSTRTFGSTYFSLGADGLSFNGSPIAIGGSNPLPTMATLSGLLSPLVLTLNTGATETVDASFTATIIPSSGSTLADGDLAIIQASPSSGPTIPEPGSVVMLIGGLLTLVGLKHKAKLSRSGSSRVRTRIVVAALAGCLALGLAGQASAAVTLNPWTAPDSGVAGVNNVNINGFGFPSGTITPANVVVTFATTCGGAAVATTSANSVITILGSVRRVNVSIPAALAQATYFLSIKDSTVGDADFTSGNCTEVKVQHTNTTLAACIPTSSLGINAPPTPNPVVAYVPNGSWSSGTTGIRVVQVEAGGGAPAAPVSVPTPSTVNSCSANPATGEAVCVANNTDVYTLTGSTLTHTLHSGSTGFTSFSGGSCENCGVAVNALTNQAIIAMGLSGSPSTSGLQVLNLNTHTFQPAIPTATKVSEDISIDPTRGYILSPNEPFSGGNGTYGLFRFNSATGAITGDFRNPPAGTNNFFDTATEDCSTGIALAGIEGTSNVFIADLTQATFTPGSPFGTWSAPQQTVALAGASFAAGTSGLSVAPGTTHLAIVSGEFGGSSFAVLQLPSTSGTGTPNIVDYAFVSGICNFSAGFDPHTMSAYTSPNDGKAYGVLVNWISGPATNLAVIDLAAVLAAPRTAGTHTVAAGAICSGPLMRFVATQ
jgi:hypothetical protein